MLKVLLLCGSGASSGFMAANIRKAAKKAGIEISVQAKSESQLSEMIDSTDVVLLGPHLAYAEKDMAEKLAQSGRTIKLAVIPQKIYGVLDGEKALKLIKNL